MANLNKIIQNINTQFPDNKTQSITAKKLRNTLVSTLYGTEENYDISVNNDDTIYANLAAALGVDGVNIPSDIRKGGMSVRFVNSNGIYEQWRYTGTSITDVDFTNINNWENITSSKIPTDISIAKVDATFVNSANQPLFYLRQASHTLAGLMTAPDKIKLDNMPAIDISTNMSLTLNDLRTSPLSASTMQKLNAIRAAEKEIVLIWNGYNYIQFFVEQYQGSFSGYVFDLANGEMLHIIAGATAPSSDWAVEINKIGGAVEGTLGNLVEIGQDNMGEDSGISTDEVVLSETVRHIVTLSQAEFDALTSYDSNTEYNVI